MSIFLSLILSMLGYLVFPIIYRSLNGKVSCIKGRKIAILNSVVCCVIFCLIAGIISGGETIITSFAPAVFYYFISKAILIDKDLPEEKKESSKKELKKDIFEQGNVKKEYLKTNKIFLENNINLNNFEKTNCCPNCNSSLKKESKFCSKCGFKIEDFFNRQEKVYNYNIEKTKVLQHYLSIILVILTIIFIILIMINLTFLSMDLKKSCMVILIINLVVLAIIVGLIITIKVKFNLLFKYILSSSFNSPEKNFLLKNEKEYINGTITKEEYNNNRKNVLQYITKFKYRILI